MLDPWRWKHRDAGIEEADAGIMEAETFLLRPADPRPLRLPQGSLTPFLPLPQPGDGGPGLREILEVSSLPQY